MSKTDIRAIEKFGLDKGWATSSALGGMNLGMALPTVSYTSTSASPSTTYPVTAFMAQTSK